MMPLSAKDEAAGMPVVSFRMLLAELLGVPSVAAPPADVKAFAPVGAHLPTSSPPIVFLKSEPSPTFSTIMIDNYGGARLATDHLLAVGRRRIRHLSGPLAWREARARNEGWRDALRDAGLEPGPVVPGTWSSASGETAFERMLEIAPDLDAVFAGNDQMALGMFHVAHRRGMAIPDDLAVVGFDGLVEGAQFTPSLTTVSQPLGELGQLAVREMLRLVAEGISNKEIAALLDLSVNTVAVHRANIMDEMGLHNTAELVVYAIRNGLVTLP